MEARPTRIRRPFLFHPILFALFPVLSLAAHNASQIEVDDVLSAAALSVLGALLLWGLLRILLGDWQKAALVTSFGIMLFFSYGHLHSRLNQFVKVRHRLLLIAIMLAFFAAAWGIRRLRRDPASLTRALNAMALLLVAIPSVRIVAYQFKARAPHAASGHAGGAGAAHRSQPAVAQPDIYYVILDAYAGAETLQSVFGYDNGPFLAHLKAKGFYVAEKSQSNYSWTPLSLASSTNMEYLDSLVEGMSPDMKDMQPFHQLIKDNRVLQALRSRGYKFVNFQSGWAVTARNENADWDINCGGFREFGRVLAQTTLLEPFGFSKRIARESRTRVLCQFETLPEIQHRIEAPRFVFAHIVSPHPPFLFGRNGEPVAGDTLKHAWTEKSLYLDQLIFITQKVQQTLDRILAEAKTPPIIVVQGDHGSSALLYEKPSDAQVCERMGILNAYHFPGGPRSLYPSISPVNTFRVVLNEYFGEQYPLLQDRSFFSPSMSGPFPLVDVTATVCR